MTPEIWAFTFCTLLKIYSISTACKLFSKFFEKISKIFRFWLGGAAPQTPRILAGGAKQTPPLNGRSSHLIEAAKRGRLDQMLFFSAPLTTRAPSAGRPTTVHQPSDNRPRYQWSYGTFFFCLILLSYLPRIVQNFKQLQNREDSSDFDDFWTKWIAPTRSII